jgi:lipopolysaccharide/colanic/teichoic acid biosynthesis glycosyltransferase
VQRFFDVIFSGIALIFLLPLLIPIVIILSLTGEREVFFVQERIGQYGKTFKLYKFATMLKNSPNLSTGTITVKGDSRILPVGQFLRKSKINELPQLLNIFFGDMSFVGPRPLTLQTFSSYDEKTKLIVNQVRPGLSGVGSIIFRAEEDMLFDEPNTVEFYRNVIAPYKGELEVWYIRNRSVYIYFLVILITIWIVLFPTSSIAWKYFYDLPVPPDDLKVILKYVKI